MANNNETKRKHIEAVGKWNKKNTRSYAFRFNVNTQSEVIEHLEKQENKSGYIANLILQDYLAKGGEMHDHSVLRVCDLAKDMDYTDMVVLVFEDGSKLYGGKKAVLNDNREVIEYTAEPSGNAKQYTIKVRYS